MLLKASTVWLSSRKSVLREFKTAKHGFLFVVRGEAKMGVDGAVYELHPGSVFHAAPGMQLDAQVTGPSEYEYYSLFYKLDKRDDATSGHPCDSHFKLEPGANPRVVERIGTKTLYSKHLATRLGGLY